MTNYNLLDNDLSILTVIVAATRLGQVAFVSQFAGANLVTQGLAECNASAINANGEIAHRATAAGLAFQDNQDAIAAQNWAAAGSAAPVAPLAQAEMFGGAQVTPAVPVAVAPAKAGDREVNGFRITAKLGDTGNVARVAVANKYPFSVLGLGESFFVPATPERPFPKKSLASTVSSANKRFSTLVPARYFTSIAVLEGQRVGDEIAPADGCYVQRIEPPVKA